MRQATLHYDDESVTVDSIELLMLATGYHLIEAGHHIIAGWNEVLPALCSASGVALPISPCA